MGTTTTDEAPREVLTEMIEAAREAAPDTRSIAERMVAILGELPAIGKDAYNEQQRFHYRSHDEVLNALNPLLAKHGVIVVPDVINRVADVRQTSQGKAMYEVNLHVRFTFYGAAGDWIQSSAWGEGTDMGDKATNKAMTGAFKNVLAQAFAVSTAETQDIDSGAPEETVVKGHAPKPAPRGAQTAPKPPKGSPPASALLPGAITGEDALARIVASLAEVDPTVDWAATIQPGLWSLWGVSTRQEIPEANYREFMFRLSNAEAKLREIVKDGEFPPPDDDAILGALRWAFDGAAIDALVLKDGAEAAIMAEMEAEADGSAADPGEEDPDDEPAGTHYDA